MGLDLGAPLFHTCSCHNPELTWYHKSQNKETGTRSRVHAVGCGLDSCFGCYERKLGFERAGVEDQSVYIPSWYLDMHTKKES